MTTPRPHTRTPLAILAGIGILIIGHSLTEPSSAQFSRTLPLLLILILGELVREWTVARLAPTVDERVLRRRRHYQRFALVAGIACMALSVIGAVADWWPAHGPVVDALFASGVVSLAVFLGLLFVRTQAAADARLAELARAGQSPDDNPPGPLVFLLVFCAALVLFATANVTAIDALLSQQALNSRQWIRFIVSAVLCGGLSLVVLRKLNEPADRPSDPANPDLA